MSEDYKEQKLFVVKVVIPVYGETKEEAKAELKKYLKEKTDLSFWVDESAE